MGQEVYYSFDEVLKVLQIEPEELENLIQEGEIKIHKIDQKKEKFFLKTEIDMLRTSKMSEATMVTAEKPLEVFDDSEEPPLEIQDGEEDAFEEKPMQKGNFFPKGAGQKDFMADLKKGKSYSDLAEEEADFLGQEEEEDLLKEGGEEHSSHRSAKAPKERQDASDLEDTFEEEAEESLPRKKENASDDWVVGDDPLKTDWEANAFAKAEKKPFVQGALDIEKEGVDFLGDDEEAALLNMGEEEEEKAPSSKTPAQKAKAPLLPPLKEKALALDASAEEEILEKEGTDELEFENLENENLASVSSLFGKEQQLPGDKVEDELFADDMESRDFAAQSESYLPTEGEPFLDEPALEEGETVGSSDPYEEELAAMQGSGRPLWKIAGGITALVASFGALACFLFLDQIHAFFSSGKKVLLYEVSARTLDKEHQFTGKIEPKIEIIEAKQAGTILSLAPVNEMVTPDKPIAILLGEGPDTQAWKKAQEETQKLQQAYDENAASFQTMRKEEKQYLDKYPVISEYKKLDKQYKETQKQEYYTKREAVKKANYAILKSYYDLYNKMKKIYPGLQEQKAALETAKAKLSQQEKALAKVEIMPLEKGFVKEWQEGIEVGKSVVADASLGTFQSEGDFQVRIQIPEDSGLSKEVLSWQKGRSLELQDQDTKLSATITSVASDAQGVFLVADLLPGNPGLALGKEVTFSYTQSIPAIAVPKGAIGGEGGEFFVLRVQDSKIVRQKITLGQAEGEFVYVTDGLKANDKIVASYDKSWKEGDPVVVQ